jgi:hypothetical protein
VTAARCAWFGIGVAGRQLSRGLPIDVAALLLAQEMVRRELGLARSEVLIADENAIGAGLPPIDVRRVAVRTRRAVAGLIEALDLSASVIVASDLARPEERRSLAAKLDPDRPYVGLQLAQVEAMRRRGASIKLGWTLGRRGFDETSFDRHYRREVGRPITTVYTVPGRRLDVRRPRACPYVCSDPDRRILVDTGRPAREVLAAAEPRVRTGYRRLLGKIVRAWAKLHGAAVPRDPVVWIEERIAEARRHGGMP